MEGNVSQAEREEELIHGRTHKQLQADARANADSVLECARELQAATADRAALYSMLAELRQLTKKDYSHGTGQGEPNWQVLRLPISGPGRDSGLRTLEKTDALLLRLGAKEQDEQDENNEKGEGRCQHKLT